MKTRICHNPTCPHEQKPLPLTKEYFHVYGKGGGFNSQCKHCRNKAARKKAQERREAYSVSYGSRHVITTPCTAIDLCGWPTPKLKDF